MVDNNNRNRLRLLYEARSFSKDYGVLHQSMLAVCGVVQLHWR